MTSSDSGFGPFAGLVEIKRLIKEGKTIDAIRLAQVHLNLTTPQAKRYVELMIETYYSKDDTK